MIYFYRNTHDENGNYRGLDYFGCFDVDKRAKLPINTYTKQEWEEQNKQYEEFQSKQLFFGVHTWDGSGEQYKLTFDEIYNKTFLLLNAHAFDGIWKPTDYRFSIEYTLKALAFMVEHKLVIAKNYE